MLQVSADLFNSWNKDVRYCHWKSNEHLKDGLDGETDLDVYVYPEDKSIAESHLRCCSYIKFVPQESSRYPMVDEWIGFDTKTGNLVHVHLHYQIITGTKFCKEYVFPIDKEIIETRVLDEDAKVYLASPEIEMIVLFARIVLKSTNKRNLTTRGYEAEVSYLKKRIDKDVLKEKCETLIGKRGDRYYELILSDLTKKDDWKELKKIIYSWLDKYRKMSMIKVFLRTKYYWAKLYKDLFFIKYFNKAVISKKTFASANISLCFLGQDGSGKSTLSIDVEKWLRWKIEAHRFYLGSGEHYKSPAKWFLSKATNFRKGNRTSEPNIKNEQNFNVKIKKKTLVSIIAAIITAYDLKNVAKRAYREIRRASNYSRQGAVSLFDRFPQNQFKGIYDGPKIRSIYVENGYDYWFIKRMAYAEEKYINKIQSYQPSVVFKLLLSPEESIKRKPFENYEQICQKHQITQKIAFKGSEIHEIDATQDYREELLHVKKIIWNYFLKNQ